MVNSVLNKYTGNGLKYNCLYFKMEMNNNLEKTSKDDLTIAKSAAYNSIDYGIKILENLNEQQESIDKIERTLDANQNIIDKSLKSIRNMTWTGYFYNHFLTVYDAISSIKFTEQPNTSSKDEKETKNIETVKNDLQMNKMEIENECSKDKDLDDISKALNILQDLSLIMGETIDKQNTDLKNIENKSQEINDKTTMVTAKAKQLTK